MEGRGPARCYLSIQQATCEPAVQPADVSEAVTLKREFLGILRHGDQVQKDE
jgi:hypothetical protein